MERITAYGESPKKRRYICNNSTARHCSFECGVFGETEQARGGLRKIPGRVSTVDERMFGFGCRAVREEKNVSLGEAARRGSAQKPSGSIFRGRRELSEIPKSP